MSQKTLIGEFCFDSLTGEISPGDGSGPTSKTRLPPQPAMLLHLLIDRYPDLVNREEIQRSIWDDAGGDFDRNLHFCIRQIRSALGDSATAPKYIETIPRRGYRLIAEPLEHSPPPESEDFVGPADNAHEEARQLRHRLPAWTAAHWPLRIAAGLLLLGTLIFAIVRIASPKSEAGPAKLVAENKTAGLVVAIMPFVPPAGRFESFGEDDIAPRLIDALTTGPSMDFQVIGPTTTLEYAGTPSGLRQLIQNHRPDFIVNGKFYVEGELERLLVELIRSTDGVHVWVQSYELGNLEALVDDVTGALRRLEKSAGQDL